MSGSAFVDTNVLVYAFDSENRARQTIASALVTRLMGARTMVISTQVLKELYVTLTRKVATPLGHDEARDISNRFIATSMVVEDTLPLFRRALLLLDEHQLSLWDACIVAAAATSGCETVFSEDLGDGRMVDGVRIIDPFLAHQVTS